MLLDWEDYGKARGGRRLRRRGRTPRGARGRTPRGRSGRTPRGALKEANDLFILKMRNFEKNEFEHLGKMSSERCKSL